MDFDFVKMMHEWGFDIKKYVVYQSITPEQYKEITGEDVLKLQTILNHILL